MKADLRRRSAAEVFEEHLRLAGEHRFQEDIERNCSPDIVILERRGIFRGREGAKGLARLLEQELPESTVRVHQSAAGRTRGVSGVDGRSGACSCAGRR